MPTIKKPTIAFSKFCGCKQPNCNDKTDNKLKQQVKK